VKYHNQQKSQVPFFYGFFIAKFVDPVKSLKKVVKVGRLRKKAAGKAREP